MASPISDEENNRRILFAAAWRGEEDRLRELVDSGRAGVNAVDENGVSALRFTAQYGHRAMTEYLLDKGADPNLRAKDGMSPLLAAVQMGHKEIVGMLLDRGADVNTRAKGVNAPMVAREKGHSEIERLLLDRGAKPELSYLEKKCRVS